MSMRSIEFVGKAEGIKSHELSVKSLMEKLSGMLSSLKGQKRSLQSELSSLYAELAAAESDTDEDGEPDYGLIASIENRIDQTNEELSDTEGEISQTSGELQRAQQEYAEVEEEKQQTLFEIQERARITSQDASKASGMFGAWASVGASLNQSFQANFDALAQAASILDGNVSAAGAQTSSSGGGGSTRTGGCIGIATATGAAAIASSGMIVSTKPRSGSLGSKQISGANSSGGRFQYAKGGNANHKGPQLSSTQTSGIVGHSAIGAAVGNVLRNSSFGSTQSSHSAGDSWKSGLQGVKNASQKEQQTGYQQEADAVGSPKSKTIAGKGPSDITGGFTMNTPKTIEEIRKQMSPSGQAYFDSQIAAGGGVEEQRAHLQGTGKEMYITSGSNGPASGNFLTREHPGKTPEERKQSLQLPPENDATRVQKVVSQKPVVVLESDISPQEKWAKEAGYKATKGMRQVFTPNKDVLGALHAEIYALVVDELVKGTAGDSIRSRSSIHDDAENEKNQTSVESSNSFRESMVSKTDNRTSILGLNTPGAVITDKYLGTVYTRISSSERTSRSIFEYALKHGMINIKSANSNEEYYDSDEKCLYLDIPGDVHDIEGSGTGLFHESGHAIDHALGGGQYLSNNKDFRNCLIKDCNTLIKKLKSDPLWRRKFMNLIKTSPDAFSVSDILEGITDGRIRGGCGHGKEYWNEDEFVVCNEAFAHFFEASMGASPNRFKYIKIVFPEAYNKYLEMIRPFTAKVHEELEREL